MKNREALHQISYGMYIITTVDENKRKYGCVMNTLTQVTTKEIKICFHLNKENETTKQILKTKKIAISILSTETDPNIISEFGFQSSKEKDKFRNISTLESKGLPVLLDASSYLIGEIIETVDMGSHISFFAKVIESNLLKEKEPMTYEYYRNVLKGKTSKKAPTYLEEQEEEGWYVCDVCGYRVKGKPKEDFICPICGRDASHFQASKK